MARTLDPPPADTDTPAARNAAAGAPPVPDTPVAPPPSARPVTVGMSAANPAASPTTPALFEKAVCLVLSLRKIGNRKKLPASLVEVDADKDLISAQKTLLSSEHLKAIAHYDGEIRRYLYGRCLPSMFMSGVYRSPFALL